MKKVYSLMAKFCCVALLCTGFASCGDDDDPDDGGKIEVTPGKYAEYARHISISDGDAPFQELDLTAAGKYFMEVYATPDFAGLSGTRAGLETGLHSGKYTKNSDGSYTLEGFGTVTINDDHSVVIEYNGVKESYTFTDTPRADGYDCSAFANEWILDELYLKASEGSQKFERTFRSIDEYLAFLDQMDEDDGDDEDDEVFYNAVRKNMKKRKAVRREQEWSYATTYFEQLIVSEYGFVFPMMRWYDTNGNFIRKDYGFAMMQWGATGNNQGIVRFADLDNAEWDGPMNDLTMRISGKRLMLRSDMTETDEDGTLNMTMEFRYNVMK